MAFDLRNHPPPLNLQPTGLLDFLQIKNGGRYPQYLRDDLQPVWDLRDHYEQVNSRLITNDAVDAQVAGAATYLIEDTANFWRRALWVSVHWNGNNAADQIEADICIGDPISGTNHVVECVKHFATDVLSYHSSYSIAAAGVNEARNTAKPFWIPPGWTVNLVQYVGVITGAPNLQFARSIVDYRA